MIDIDPTLREAVIAAGTAYSAAAGMFARWAVAPVLAAFRLGRAVGWRARDRVGWEAREAVLRRRDGCPPGLLLLDEVVLEMTERLDAHPIPNKIPARR